MRLYSELLYSCIFQYMEEAMNCSIGSGQNYFSLSCSIFFFSLRITYSVVHAILSISVLFEHCVFCAFSITGKIFLWVELHENYTAQNMLEYRSSMGTLRIIFAEHSFWGNPQNMQRLNRTEIDSALPHCPR